VSRAARSLRIAAAVLSVAVLAATALAWVALT
jgi:hypothetical protein